MANEVAITQANVGPLPGSIVVNGQAGGTVGIGDLVHLAADGDWIESDASAAATAKTRGVVVTTDDGDFAAGDGDGIGICIFGPVTGFSGMAEGDIHFLSDTAGRLSTVVGTVFQNMGYALKADVFFILPGIVAIAS